MERNKYYLSQFLILLLITSIFMIFSSLKNWSKNDQNRHKNTHFSPKKLLAKNKTNNSIVSSVLLFYVYAETHKYAYDNFKYFLDTAVRQADGIDYIFILQQVHQKAINETEMPPLPEGNAFYYQHENTCFDYGTIGWFIEKHTIGNPWKQTSANTTNDLKKKERKFDLRKYKYFIMMNSSIRGPFFPVYFLKFHSDYEQDFNEKFYWYYVFTKRITEQVKLVGCTFSCDPRQHIQSYFVSTDWIGMSLLLKSGGIDGVPGEGVFKCSPSKGDTIRFSELGASKQILEGNYSLNSLMTKYYTLDFTKQNNYRCSVIGNPYSDKNLDRTSLEPYDVVFVKFNDRGDTLDAQNRAKLYQKWMQESKAMNGTS